MANLHVEYPPDRKEPLPDDASIASSFVSVSPAQSVNSATLDDEPPPYSAVVNEESSPLQWTSHDPRSSSSQSLHNQDINSDTRRKLLLIYIHGFMGNETSFQSFPAHVHNLVTVLLGDSHVVHTKVYPRYLTKRVLAVAAADFSKWLEPHESEDTDVVLLGHSMGGLMSAEVALMPPHTFTEWPLRHRILGTINFDVPFLGMHPGVVKSGLSSIFKPYPNPGAPSPTSASSSTAEPFWLSGPNESTYNQVFANDANHPVRKGWKNAFHFMNKHSTNLIGATHQLIQNHIEFGSAMTEFDNLKVRYVRLRMLEEDDAQKRGSVIEGKSAPRVRFVNYYTASHGRPKKVKSPTGESTPSLPSQATGASQRSESIASGTSGQPRSASIPAMEHVDPKPEDDDDLSHTSDLEEIETLDSMSTAESYPMSPGSLASTDSMPQAPEPPGPGPLLIDYRSDLAGFKVALAEHRKKTKEYAHALKDYHKALYHYRKGEAKRRHVERKATMDAHAEELRFEAELRDQESKRIAAARTPQEKRMAVEAMRERRKHEFDLRREQLKRKVEEEKERRKLVSEQAKEQRKHEKQQLKSDKDALKTERKAAKDELKQQEKLARLQRKVDAKGKCPIGRPGPLSAKDMGLEEVVFDANDAAAEPDFAEKPNIIRSTSDAWPDEKAGAGDDASTTTRESDKKPLKDKKFCLLPPKDAQGHVDGTWRRVFMADVDEVGAHCGLFFPQGITAAEAPVDGQGWGERYGKLVGDVAERIEGWVHEDLTERVIRGVQGL